MSNIIIDSTLEPSQIYGMSVSENNQAPLIASTVIANTVRRGSEEDLLRRCSYEEMLKNVRYDPVFHDEDRKLLLAANHNVELIETLMKYGKNSLKVPALYLATLYQDSHAVELLVKAGAEVTQDTLSLAKKIGSPVLLHILIEIKSVKMPHHYGFSMTRKDYLFSTEFELDSEEIEISYVKKTRLSIRSHYALEGAKGTEAKGTVRILSMGTIFPWGKDINIYDEKDEYLGMIDGEALTTADAKFSIYNGDGEKVGIAYLDDNKTGFTIVHPENYARVIARLKREFVKDIPDTWKVKVYQGDDIDSRILKLFAAFAVDTEGLFKKDE